MFAMRFLFTIQKPIAYLTPARAILKTTMGMLGEFEYDSIFNEEYYPTTMAWAIYCAYLVINCIILMNLLVSYLFFIFTLITSAERFWFSIVLFKARDGTVFLISVTKNRHCAIETTWHP